MGFTLMVQMEILLNELTLVEKVGLVGLYLGLNARGNTFVSLISYPGILADTPVDVNYSNTIYDYDQSNSGVAPTISSGARSCL